MEGTSLTDCLDEYLPGDSKAASAPCGSSGTLDAPSSDGLASSATVLGLDSNDLGSDDSTAETLCGHEVISSDAYSHDKESVMESLRNKLAPDIINSLQVRGQLFVAVRGKELVLGIDHVSW